MEALSYSFIEDLSDKVLTDYFGTQRFPLAKIDIDAFARDYLNLDIRYEQLCYDGEEILGLTAHYDITLGLPLKKPRVFKNVRKDTVLLDSSLAESQRAAQRAFTIAHECGHQILARLAPDGTDDLPQTHAFYKPNANNNSPLDWNEWQANVIASTLLMPRFLVEGMQLINQHTQNYIIYGDGYVLSEEKQEIKKLAASLGVSYSAMLYRLKKLNKVDVHDYMEYIFIADEERLREGDVYAPFFGRPSNIRQNPRRARPAQGPIIITCD